MEREQYCFKKLDESAISIIKELFVSAFSNEPWNDDWSNEKQRWEDNGYRICNAMFRKDLSLKNRNDEDCKRVFFKRENVDLETMINACEKMGFIRG